MRVKAGRHVILCQSLLLSTTVLNDNGDMHTIMVTCMLQ